MKRKKKKKKATFFRDPFVIPAKTRSGAGYHKHPKHSADKMACRKWKHNQTED